MSSYRYPEPPRLEDIEPATHTEVLVADSRVDQGRIRAVLEGIFDAHPTLGSIFELRADTWTPRPGGGWGWAVEPPGGNVVDVIGRQRGSFDVHTGRLFAASLLPGARDRVVLTASRLCMDFASWQAVVDELVSGYGGGLARRAA